GVDEIAALRFRPSSELVAKVREISHVETGDARHSQGVLPRPLDHGPVVVQRDVTSHREEAVPNMRLAFIEVADEHRGSTITCGRRGPNFPRRRSISPRRSEM